ncbi:flagellar biosynthesis protein FlhB [Neobacillus cucumis]|uniref:Flagellar biosynthetic protein FlhB n=1 Tax=Neobacillus cucumis TaxID=1740721 RepID=A0A2N5H7I0_9BACI|nr:flagellar biosynthesis protein FlhB [Neobacillus cucumis]PLS01468.1 flagellar biosynthesis protein FlhB [Neobacillus cucumis]
MKGNNYLLQVDLQWFAEEKTEKATPQKRREARKKGQVAKSPEVSSSLMLLSFFLFLLFYGSYFGTNILVLFQDLFSSYLLLDLTESSTHKLFVDITILTEKIVLPILALLFVMGLLANYFQIGFLFTTENLKFDFKKINPVEGAKRILSMRSIVDLLKNVLKMVLISWTAYVLLKKEIAAFLHLSQLGITQMIEYLFTVIVKIGVSASAVYVVLGAADFLYQKYDHEKKLKMSLKEVKDEHKKSEGDPLVKGKIKEMQRAMSLNRMMSDVPKADVVITNPTHYAIAIVYDANDSKAPVVIAKGVDFMAQKIKEIAREHDIILSENKPLARALYANVEVGQEIPEELFKAVAEILAYVYRLKGKF